MGCRGVRGRAERRFFTKITKCLFPALCLKHLQAPDDFDNLGLSQLGIELYDVKVSALTEHFKVHNGFETKLIFAPHVGSDTPRGVRKTTRH